MASTSASHSRAPASRGSRPSWAQSATPQRPRGRVPGRRRRHRARRSGWVRRAGCSTVFEPGGVLDGAAAGAARTPPMPSSAMDRNRPWWAARSSRSRSRSSRRLRAVGVEPAQHGAAQCGQVGGVVVAGLVEQQPLRGRAEIGVDRQPVHGRDHHLRLGPGDRPGPSAAPVSARSPPAPGRATAVRRPALHGPRSPRSRSPWPRPSPRSVAAPASSIPATTAAAPVQHRPQPLQAAHRGEQLRGRSRGPPGVVELGQGVGDRRDHWAGPRPDGHPHRPHRPTRQTRGRDPG